MSKFLLNLLVQISKALVYSKIQFLIKKDFFQLSAHMAQPAAFFLLPHWSRARKPPPPAGLAPPPWSAPTTSTGGKIPAASLLHFSIMRRPSSSSIPDNRRLPSGGIEAPSTLAIEGTRPPPASPPPNKRPPRPR
jgi:hypothetical protein